MDRLALNTFRERWQRAVAERRVSSTQPPQDVPARMRNPLRCARDTLIVVLGALAISALISTHLPSEYRPGAKVVTGTSNTSEPQITTLGDTEARPRRDTYTLPDQPNSEEARQQRIQEVMMDNEKRGW